jgi:hypothetical protein
MATEARFLLNAPAQNQMPDSKLSPNGDSTRPHHSPERLPELPPSELYFNFSAAHKQWTHLVKYDRHWIEVDVVRYIHVNQAFISLPHLLLWIPFSVYYDLLHTLQPSIHFSPASPIMDFFQCVLWFSSYSATSAMHSSVFLAGATIPPPCRSINLIFPDFFNLIALPPHSPILLLWPSVLMWGN